jgi:hypothetical protein
MFLSFLQALGYSLLAAGYSLAVGGVLLQWSKRSL